MPIGPIGAVARNRAEDWVFSVSAHSKNLKMFT